MACRRFAGGIVRRIEVAGFSHVLQPAPIAPFADFAVRLDCHAFGGGMDDAQRRHARDQSDVAEVAQIVCKARGRYGLPLEHRHAGAEVGGG